MDLLTKYQMQFTAVFPGFSPKTIIGSCIDTFHKNPSHQRQMLANPGNLPYKTDIAVGDLRFELNVTATMDDKGEYVGNALEWSDVTEVRKKELEVARLLIPIKGFQEVLDRIFRPHFRCCAVRTPNFQRSRPARRPAASPQGRQVTPVVGVQV